MILPPEEETESYKWTHQNTLLFLDLYKKYRKQVGSLRIKNLRTMYEEISKELQYLTKTKITAANCDNRWKVLERSYKKYIDNSKKTGRGRKNFEYADIMNDILGAKRNIHPVILLSSDTINNPVEKENEQPIMEGTTEPIPEPSGSRVQEERQDTAGITSKSNTEKPILKKTYENKRLKYNILKEVRSDRKEYYRKRLEIEEKKLEEKVRK